MQSDSKNCKDLKMAYIRVRKPYVSLIMNHLKAVQGKGHMPALDKSKFPFLSSALSRGSLSAFPKKNTHAKSPVQLYVILYLVPMVDICVPFLFLLLFC